MIKKILIPIIISLILIVGLAIIHDTLYHFFPIQHKSIGFGLTVKYTGIIFAMLILTYNIYLEFKSKFKYAIGLIFFIITIILPLQAFDYRPNRSVLLIVLTFLGFGLSMIIKQRRLLRADKKLNNRK